MKATGAILTGWPLFYCDATSPPETRTGAVPPAPVRFTLCGPTSSRFWFTVPRTRINLSTQVYTNIAHTRNTNAHRDNEADCDLRHILKNDSPANCGPDHQRTNEKQDVADVATKTATNSNSIFLEIPRQTTPVAKVATHPKIAATALSRIIATKSTARSRCSSFFDPSLQVRMRVCARDTRISKHSQVIISRYGIHRFSGLTDTASPGITRARAHMRA